MSYPEGEGAQSGAVDPQSGVGTPTTGTATDPTVTDPTQSGETGQTNAELEAARQAATSYQARMKAADQRAAQFEQELRQLRDKDLPEADKLKREVEEAQATVATLQETNNNLAFEVAFLKDNTYTWHDPATALKLVDRGVVEISADGTASGMKDALKALATSHAFLIKQDATETLKPPAATSPGNNGNSSTSRPSGKGMATRLPAMNTRVRRG